MTRGRFHIAALIGLLAGPVAASPFVPLTEEHLNPGVVEIVVPAQDLERCRLTVQQVLTTSPIAPATADDFAQDTLTPAVSGNAFTGPQVICVAEKPDSLG